MQVRIVKKGSLNKPPDVLFDAMINLQARHIYNAAYRRDAVNSNKVRRRRDKARLLKLEKAH